MSGTFFCFLVGYNIVNTHLDFWTLAEPGPLRRRRRRAGWTGPATWCAPGMARDPCLLLFVAAVAGVDEAE